jgi:hypothetical protein
MFRPRSALGVLAVPLLLACSDRFAPNAPTQPVLLSSSGPSPVVIDMRDDCDPKTFNAELGPGTCVGDGGTTFDEFIEELTEKRIVGAWKNNPDKFNTRVGTKLNVVNIGGEAHTFTHVAKFGGGIVPELNKLSGNPMVAPECNTLVPTDFVPPGGKFTILTGRGGLPAGTHRFQCCIHPWMRTTADLRRS